MNDGGNTNNATNITFLDIPDDITQKILKLEPVGEVDPCFRLIRHRGELQNTDFYPTFRDEEQLKYKCRNRGNMANIISNMYSENLPDYAMSLFLSKEYVIDNVWRKPHLKKIFPCLARGKFNPNRGMGHLDSKNHLLCFLFDFINNNPKDDFKIDEVIREEIKSE